MISEIVAYGNDIYFTAQDSNNLMNLYRWNNIAVSKISNTNGVLSDNPATLTVAGSNLYFEAYINGYLDTALFKWDGATVSQIGNINSNGLDLVGNFVELSGDVYFSALDSNGYLNRKVYKYEP